MGLLKGIYYSLINASLTFTTFYMSKRMIFGSESKKGNLSIDILIATNMFIGFHYGYTGKYLLEYIK